MTGTLAAAAPVIPAPQIEYGQLSPMLLVFGAAIAGVLVEAFAPRALRRPLHLASRWAAWPARSSLTIAVAASTSVRGGSPGHVAAVGRGRRGPADPVHPGHDPASWRSSACC